MLRKQRPFMKTICRRKYICLESNVNQNLQIIEPLEFPLVSALSEFWLAQKGCLINKPIHPKHYTTHQ